MHIPKKGLRVLGVAESYAGREHSTLAGIVMRKDLIIDGCGFSRVTVGGNDATEGVLAIVNSLDRKDINAIFLSGCVIAFFNIIDPAHLYDATGRAVICVTYEDSAGLEGDILHHFPGDTARLAAYRNLGDRTPHTLPDGQVVYLRSWGISREDAGSLCSGFTREGKIPEPLRVARIAARATHRFCTGISGQENTGSP